MISCKQKRPMIYTIMDVFFFEYEIFCNSECLPVCVCVLADIFARAKTSQKYFMVEEGEGGREST